MSERGLPVWIRDRKLDLGELHSIRRVVAEGHLHTVCDEARCPNRSECFSKGTATFLIMGDICTRSCRYCSITHGRPRPLEPNEPQDVARTAEAMGLAHVVVTSVDRDDLPDGGAARFADVVRALKSLSRTPTVEVLTPDFRGDVTAIETVIAAGPDVYNHNVETVRRLYPQVRRSGRYEWALQVIAQVATAAPRMLTKSGLMVGLGERDAEVRETLRDLQGAGCKVVTIGQYLQPTRREIPVARFWHPEEFEGVESYGRALGLEVVSGPFIRSSYRAEEAYQRATRPCGPLER